MSRLDRRDIIRIMETKECHCCKEVQSIELFYAQKDSKDGLRSMCKICTKLKSKIYSDKNKKPKIYREPVDHRFSFYNLTKKQFHEMLIFQNNKCFICNIEFNINGRSTAPCVDHDHECCPHVPTCGHCTRALLCFKCNMGLGFLNDDRIIIQGALKYLDSFSKPCYTASDD